MNKKGMVIKQIIYMVLSLIVLVVIIGVPLYDYANTQFFGGKGVKRWINESNEPFTPYKSESDIEEQKVHDSMKALICATNVVASDKLEYKNNCEGAVEKNNAMCYGNSCVSCKKELPSLPNECSVNEFELPQKVDTASEQSSLPLGLGYISPLNWISAYGDPKYVIYYEAFPLGEEEAWQLDVSEVSLSMIAAFDIGLPVGGALFRGGKTAITKGAEILADSKLAKAATLMSKASGTYYVYKFVAATGRVLIRPITWTASKISGVIKSGVTYTKDAAGKIVMKSISPEIYIKVFADAESVLKYAKQEDIKKFFDKNAWLNLDELVEGIRKNDESVTELAEHILKDPKISLAKTSFLEKLKDLPANIKPFAEKSALNMLVLPAAIVMSKEDSMDDKFAPIGVNAIGFKKPYNEALITGQTLPGLNDDANKYFLALNKDGDLQQRFFLASPCKTNLKVTSQKCKCGESEDVDIINMGGEDFFAHKLSIEDGKHDFAVKECRELKLGAGEMMFTWDLKNLIESRTKNVNCISIEPQEIEGFCYSGSHLLASGTAWAFYGTSFFTGVGATALKATLVGGGTVAAGPVGTLAGLAASAGVGVLQTGVDYSLAFLEHWATSYTKWPNH